MQEASYDMFKDSGGPEKNQNDETKCHIVAACQSPYGVRSDNYVVFLIPLFFIMENNLPMILFGLGVRKSSLNNISFL